MRRSARRLVASGGFSLLEAIVAMVLISGAGMALFAWINGSIASLTSLQDANRRSDATANILEYMDRVNPMQSPQGEASLGPYSIRWRAHPASDVVNGVNYPRGRSLYQIAIYNVKVSVFHEDRNPWFTVQLRQVGYNRVGEPPRP